MSCLFKIWCNQRVKKTTVICEPTLSAIIGKACEKLNFEGSTLVFEEDGTLVDDETLQFLTLENKCPQPIFLLLRNEEIWKPQNDTITKPLVLNDKTNANRKHLRSNKDGEEKDPLEISGNKDGEEKDPLEISGDGDNGEVVSDDEANASTSDQENEALRLKKFKSHASTASNVLQMSFSNSMNTDWNQFQIHWPLEGQPFWAELKDGVSNKQILTTFAQNIVSQMELYSSDITSESFEIVGKKMFDKFPETFGDYFEKGKLFRQGYAVIKRKLKERYTYVHRFASGLSKQIVLPLKHQKLVTSAKAACANWQPDHHVEGETSETLRQAEEFLSLICQAENVENISSETRQQIYLSLEKTYANQRLFFNAIAVLPKINEIQDSWPLLLKKEFMFWHYGVLMNQTISVLENSIVQNYKKLFMFRELQIKQAKKSNTKNKDGITPEVIVTYELTENLDEKCEQLLSILSEHFNEKLESVIFDNENPDESSNLILPEYPCIVRRGNISVTYHLAIDTVQLEGTEDFIEAFKMFFASFYIFNRRFPDTFAATMQFIQEYFLRIQPKEGSKCRQHSSISKKVLALFRKLRDINVQN